MFNKIKQYFFKDTIDYQIILNKTLDIFDKLGIKYKCRLIDDQQRMVEWECAISGTHHYPDNNTIWSTYDMRFDLILKPNIQCLTFKKIWRPLLDSEDHGLQLSHNFNTITTITNDIYEMIIKDNINKIYHEVTGYDWGENFWTYYEFIKK